MNDLPPLVFKYFKLPPNHEHFLRIRETLLFVFVPQLAKLNSALEAAQTICPSPQATQVLLDARKAAANEVDKLWDFFHTVEGIASRYITFLDYLSQNNLKEERYAYYFVCLLAKAGTTDSEMAQQVMNNVREGIENATSRIISIMASDGTDVSLFIDESSKVLAEIAAAADDCHERLRECCEDFTKLQKEDFDEESFLRDPSREEFQVVQQKWRAFSKTVRSLWGGWTKLKDDIRGAPEDFSRLKNAPGDSNKYTTSTSFRAAGNPTPSTDNPNSRMAPDNSALATPPHPSSSNKTKIPFWRRTLRRIMPCLSSKSFS